MGGGLQDQHLRMRHPLTQVCAGGTTSQDKRISVTVKQFVQNFRSSRE